MTEIEDTEGTGETEKIELLLDRAENNTDQSAWRRLLRCVHENLPSVIEKEMGEEWPRFRERFRSLKRKKRSFDYTEEDVRLIQSGTRETWKALCGERAMEILACLEDDMDPWCSGGLAWKKQLPDLLEEYAVRTEDEAAGEYALILLSRCGYPPYLILEEHIDEMAEGLRPLAQDLLDD